MKKRIGIIAAALVILTLCCSFYATSLPMQSNDGELKIMSLNVLTTSKESIDQIYQGRTRGEMLIDVLEAYQPHSIGLNEVTSEWRNYLSTDVIENTYSNSIEYSMTGLKADNEVTDLLSGSNEFSPILYRSDLFEIETSGGFWLSETPHVKSKYGDILDSNGRLLYKGMNFERVVSYAVFKHINTNEIAYIHINTHYDHNSSDYVNLLCAIQVKNKADELSLIYDAPIIISGDMNATEDDQAYAYMNDEKNGYLNTKYITSNHSLLSTSAGFGEDYNPLATDVIDHIFVSAGLVGVYKHDIIVNPYLSDHSAVYTELNLTTMPKLLSLEVNNELVDGFTENKFKYDMFLSSPSAEFILTSHAAAIIEAKVNHLEVQPISMTYGLATFNVALTNGENIITINVSDSNEMETVYRILLYKEYNEPLPIISEIYPNAELGYKYFEVTNVGTKTMSTEDYVFLWGNIANNEFGTVNWEAQLDMTNKNRLIRPGETVIFWLTNGGVFNGSPTLTDFNRKYYTLFDDSNIIIFDPSIAFIGYVPNAESQQFTMGGNKDRGMRIAAAKNSLNIPYGWTKMPTNSKFNGPSISVSSYKGISESSLTTKQLFKFKHNDNSPVTVASDVLSSYYATPGKYDVRIGNEHKDAYVNLEAELFDANLGVEAEGNIIGATRNNTWAFYSNVDFGVSGAHKITVLGAVKNSNSAGAIEVYIDGKNDGSLANATLIGRVLTTGTGTDWNNQELFVAYLNQTVTGTHNVTLVFIPHIGKTYVINLDYFVFEEYVPSQSGAKSAFDIIEAEWATVSTTGTNINNITASPTKQFNPSAVSMSPNVTNGYNLLGNTVNQSTVRYDGIDFGHRGITGIVFNLALRTSRCIGIADIYIANQDGSLGTKLGYVNITAQDATDNGVGHYNNYEQFRGVVTSSNVTGLQSIIVKFNTSSYYFGNLDYFYFEVEG